MLSRVADSIYWMSRYFERAENVARVVDVNERLTLDLLPGMPHRWEPLIEVMGDSTDFGSRYDDSSQDNVIQFLTFDPFNPNSIISCLRNARSNARSIREIISTPMWSEINDTYLFAESHAASPDTSDRYDLLRRVRRSSQILEGVTNSTFSRTEAWHFSQTGRLLERADKMSRILDVKYYMLLPSPSEVGSPTDDLHWTAVLQSASAFEMYRQKYGMVRLDRTAEFLILDQAFPRSIRNCLQRADESLRAVSGTLKGTFNNEAERLMGRLVSELDYADVNEVIVGGLHEYLDDIQFKIISVDQAIHSTFFAPRTEHRTSGTSPIL